jgi:hypothetical protein
VSFRRGFRAILVGAIAFLIGLIYVPQCTVRIYADNANALSFGLAAVMTFFAYRSK